MRSLAIILLLLLAVACDSVHEAIESGFNLAVATRVPTPTNTIDDDVTELEFEVAAGLRDQIVDLRKVLAGRG